MKRLTDEINIHILQDYLTSTGWLRIEGIPGDIAIYRQPENELDELLIPLDENFVDYRKRILEAIILLADFEKRSVLEIFQIISKE